MPPAHRKPKRSIAWIGGCTDTNEFNYLVVKAMRALGFVPPGKIRPELTRPHGLNLGPTFASAMTNGWVDIKTPT